MKVRSQFITQASIIVLVALLFSVGCKKDDKEDDPEPTPIDQEFGVIDVSGHGNWDYWVIDKSGGEMFVNVENNRLVEIFIQPAGRQTALSFFFNEAGMPYRAIQDQFVFCYGNYSGQMLDYAEVNSEGQIEVYRELEIEFRWSSYPCYNGNACSGYRDVIRWAADISQALVAGINQAHGQGIGGLQILDHIGSVESTNIVLYEMNSNAASQYAEYLHAGGIEVCLQTQLNIYLNWNDHCDDFVALLINEIRVAEAALIYGNGDVQVTLTWDNTADVDLHVFDPAGEEVYWSHPYSLSGGKLDVDDIDGYGPENIFWPQNGAIDGSYSVHVHHYSGESPSYYTVLVNAFGHTRKFQGSVNSEQSVHICDFSPTGIGGSKSQHMPDILSVKNR